MSGITGVYRFGNNDLEPGLLRDMTDRILHRGPDGSGTWHDGPIGFGHRMLRSTPESLHERLPQTYDSYTITSDARIDNREELITALGITSQPEEITDSELIVRAYSCWGVQCPEKLLGDFAFAIWDGSRQTLFCARDHMGVKPFYYYHAPCEFFAFASEMKALFCIPEVPREVNEVQIGYFLAATFEDREITFYSKILRLPAAHALIVTTDQIQLRQYWSLNPARKVRFASDQEYERAYRDLFEEAVRCRLRSTFPIGSELSGGLDSSSVVCVARDLLRDVPHHMHTPPPLHTFSAIFEDVPVCDERYFINAVVNSGGLQSDFVPADQRGPLTDVVQMLQQHDEPFAGSLSFIGRALLQRAQKAGIRILLDGEFGDEALSLGFDRLIELLRGLKWHVFLSEVNELSKNYGVSRYAILRPFFDPSIPQILRSIWRSLRASHRQSTAPDRLIKRDFARRIRLIDRLKAFEGTQRARFVAESHYQQLTSGFIQYLCEVRDRELAAFSIEGRHPFLDRRLIEFCLALPPEQKLYKGYNRAVARRALADYLPNEIRWRGSKGSHALVFERGLLTFDRALVENVLFAEHQPVDNYVDMLQAREAFNLLTKGHKQGVFGIFLVAILALWLEKIKLTANHDNSEQLRG